MGWGDRRWGGLEASGSSLDPPPQKGALTPHCPLLAAGDGPGSGGGLEAVLRSQVPSATCVQIQVLPLPIYAAASRDFTSLLQFPWVLKEFNRGYLPQRVVERMTCDSPKGCLTSDS